MNYSEFIKKTIEELFASSLSINFEELDTKIDKSLDEFDEIFEEILLKLKKENKKFFKDFEKKIDDFSSFEDAMKNKFFFEFVILLTTEVFSDEKYFPLGFKMIELYFNNNKIEDIFEKSKFVYGSIFKLVIKELSDVMEMKSNETLMIIEKYFETLEKFVDEDTVIRSLIIFQEIKEKIVKWNYLIPSEDFFKESNDIFKNLIDNDEEDKFRIYFFDWVIKFGYLLESHFKNILKVQLKLKLLKKNERYGHIKKKNKNSWLFY